jgi:hypothetical protein
MEGAVADLTKVDSFDAERAALREQRLAVT